MLKKEKFVPTEVKILKFNKLVNNFSNKYLGRIFLPEYLKKKPYFTEEFKKIGEKFREKLKNRPKKRYIKMTNSQYAQQGRLLSYHFDSRDMEHDYKLIMPYIFMPEGYRTLTVQHFFSLYQLIY